jgi:hypothetical protein
MATRRNQIVSEITALEGEINARTERIEALKNELANTLPDLLDRDPEADTRARVESKNRFLRENGLIP